MPVQFKNPNRLTLIFIKNSYSEDTDYSLLAFHSIILKYFALNVNSLASEVARVSFQ